MTIKAVIQNGRIEPLEPLPKDWLEGQEVVVESEVPQTAREIDQWSSELEAAAARVPAADHKRFMEALDEIERESKEAMRTNFCHLGSDR